MTTPLGKYGEPGTITGVNTSTKYALVAGGAAGNLTLTGILANDLIKAVLVFNFTGGALTDQTSEFTVVADNTIDNTGGTATTGKTLLVIYVTTAWHLTGI